MIALTETGKLTMFKPKVSLVFPCWHAAKHMQHVLEDLQAQTFKDFEAILVNDGDNSQVEAMEAIAAQDSRIRIVRLEQNGGLANARNVGTDATTANWVTYPDPDDRFGPNYIANLYEAVDGTGVEMACGGYTEVKARTGKCFPKFIDISNSCKVMDISTVYDLVFGTSIMNVAWNKLYNKEVMRKYALCHNNDHPFHQDVSFNCLYYHHINRVGLVRDCNYYYYIYGEGTNCRRYHNNLMQVRYEIIGLKEELHRYIGWSEQKVTEIRTYELACLCLYILENVSYKDSPLNTREATAKIQTELFDQKEFVNAILHCELVKNYRLRITRCLVRIGNARLAVLTFRTLGFCKRHFGKMYSKTKSLFRGE